MADQYLVVGLGNPGRRYSGTRHNAGFMVVDELIRRYQLPAPTEERKALTTDGLIKGKRTILAKPQTYMNLSGEAVRALTDFYRIEPERVLVIYDDIDISLGTLRVRKTGGHGGQNGVRNIIQHLGTRDFGRIRFGIGRPPGRMTARDYVLQRFTGDEEILAQEVIERAADAVETWLAEGIDIAMSRHNGNVNEPAEPPTPDPAEKLAVAQRAHELAPDDPAPLVRLAELYKQVGRLDDAVQAHLKLGELYERQGQPQAMLKQWERAVSIQPSLVDVQEKIARTYEAQGDSKRAVTSWLRLADYYLKQGQLMEALQMVQEALRVNPQHPRAREMQMQVQNRMTL